MDFTADEYVSIHLLFSYVQVKVIITGNNND